MKYRVLKISNNLSEYPECSDDTAEFPELIDSIEDEMEIFVMDEDGSFCISSEFFHTHDVTTFITQ